MKYKRKGRCLIMAENRIYNFSAGPSMLPLEVLKKAQSQMLNYEESGMSVMEMSHRSKAYDAIITKTQERMRSIMKMCIRDRCKGRYVICIHKHTASMLYTIRDNLATIQSECSRQDGRLEISRLHAYDISVKRIGDCKRKRNRLKYKKTFEG